MEKKKHFGQYCIHSHYIYILYTYVCSLCCVYLMWIIVIKFFFLSINTLKIFTKPMANMHAYKNFCKCKCILGQLYATFQIRFFTPLKYAYRKNNSTVQPFANKSPYKDIWSLKKKGLV